MGFIRQFKNTFLGLCVSISILLLGIISFVPLLSAEGPDTPVVSEANKIATTSVVQASSDANEIAEDAADPNDVAKNVNEAVIDPNNLSDDDDNFNPNFSAYLKITKLFEEIFTPQLIVRQGLVDYSTLRRKRQDLVRAAGELKELNPVVLMALSKNDKQALKAFWINTYNLCILQLVIDHYPIEPKLYMIFYPDNSIMQISGNWRTKYFFDIQGFEYNLKEIEENFLLERFKDPRIIFALSYASQSGGILRNEPYTAQTLDKQLDDQVRKYLQTPQGMKIDKENNILYLSTLFSMHGHRELFLESEYAKIKKFRDRKPDEQAWLNFIWNYLPEEIRQYLEDKSPDIEFMKYDWHLNDAD